MNGVCEGGPSSTQTGQHPGLPRKADEGAHSFPSTSQTYSTDLSGSTARHSHSINQDEPPEDLVFSPPVPLVPPLPRARTSSIARLHTSGSALEKPLLQSTSSPLSPSPSSASPLLAMSLVPPTHAPSRSLDPISTSVSPPRRPFDILDAYGEPDFSPGGLTPRPVRRRSTDGGVRLAGGPPGSARRAGEQEEEARSTASTLPPLYQVHPS